MNERNQGGRRGRTGQQMEERPLPPRQTPAQRRAQEAWAWVELAKRLDKTNKDRYLTLARKLSGYLQVSGFEQTMAFLFSKAKQSRQTPEGLLFMQLGEYVGRELDQTLPPNAPLSNIMSALLALWFYRSHHLYQDHFLSLPYFARANSIMPGKIEMNTIAMITKVKFFLTVSS